MAMDSVYLTKDEELFIQKYYDKLNILQQSCAEGMSVYTKVSITYATTHKLLFFSLLFHPLSVVKKKTSETPETNSLAVKKTLQEIIEFETIKDTTYLSSEELTRVIAHYRKLEKL